MLRREQLKSQQSDLFTLLWELYKSAFPEDELTRRRIAFYQREGFVLNHWHYEHPPYIGEDVVNLLIMSYPTSISESELERFKQDNFPIIHFR